MISFERYENSIGDLMLVINEEYIIFDRHDLAPKCEMYDETAFQKYIDNGYKKSSDNDEKSLVGYCACNSKLFENNRIKVRDYFECPKCGKISTRNDLLN